MSEADRRKWDERHAAGGPQRPDPFVVAALPVIRSLAASVPRSALDVACGRGRHALLLAREGLDVVGVDVSPVALDAVAETAAAERLPVRTVHLDLDEGRLPEGPFGVVVVSHFFDRRLWPALRSAVAPGGLLIVQAFADDDAERAVSSRAYCLEAGELLRELAGFDVLSHRRDDDGRRAVESALARRRA